MFKKQLLLSIITLSFAFPENRQQNEDVSYYDTIYLKNTNIIVGEILSPANNNSDYVSIKLKSNGKTQYYYLADIAKIEYDSMKIILPPKPRKAFDIIASIGAGIHNFEGELLYNPSLDAFCTEAQSIDSIKNVHSLSTDIKFGFAISRQTSIYLSRKDDWFNLNNNGSNILMSNSLSSIGCQIYAEPVGTVWKPNYYYSFGLGASIWGNYKNDNYESWTGFGFFLGMGYEITKNINVELNVTSTSSESNHQDLWEYRMETFSPQLFINYTI